MKPDLRTKEARAAQEYMKHKGYPNVRPFHVERVEGMACWYFYYELPEVEIELEVEWVHNRWWCRVVLSRPIEDRTPALSGR